MDLDADRLIISVSRWLHISPKPRRIDWSKPVHGYVALMAWFRICRFRVTRARENRRPVRAGSQLESCPMGEATSLPGSGSPGLKWPEAQQRKPVLMALAGHQFPWAFAVALGTAAAHETTMVQEELQQVQVWCARRLARSSRWKSGP